MTKQANKSERVLCQEIEELTTKWLRTKYKPKAERIEQQILSRQKTLKELTGGE